MSDLAEIFFQVKPSVGKAVCKYDSVIGVRIFVLKAKCVIVVFGGGLSSDRVFTIGDVLAAASPSGVVKEV